MKNKIIKIIIFILMVALALLHTYYFTHMPSHDEIWNFGFGVNIINGLLPYKDFNMVITPLFPYILSLVLSIFGKKLIVYHIFIAIMITIITFIASKKIKYYSLLIYFALLIYSLNGYNTSTLLWLFLLLSILDKEDKRKEFLIPIIISMMILTKQTMLLLIIPNFIYSKNKKKTFLIYLTICLGYFVYLISQNNFMEFFDYCLFGMFDFASNNILTSPLLIVIQISICLILIYELIKSKWKNQYMFYVLLYQVMVIPILEINHFVLSFSAFIFVMFKNMKINSLIKNTLFILLLSLEIMMVFIRNEMFTIRDSENYEKINKKDSFMNGRIVAKYIDDYVEDVDEVIKKYPNHEVYIFGNNSYIAKMELALPINKYDLINNGNMGYRGEEKYIKEIDNNCKNKKCLFIIDEYELNRIDYTQVNKEILLHVIDNAIKFEGNNIFGVYINTN